MDLALEVLRRVSLSSAWGAWECWGGGLCGFFFWSWERILVFLEALLHLPSVASLFSLFEEKRREERKKETLQIEMGGLEALLESKGEETSPGGLSLGAE